MQWTRCNHRHAMARHYEWFWQGSRSRRWMTAPGYLETVARLRALFGESESWVDNPTPRSNWDAKTRVRNQHWWVDSARHRLWVRDQARLMLALTG